MTLLAHPAESFWCGDCPVCWELHERCIVHESFGVVGELARPGSKCGTRGVVRQIFGVGKCKDGQEKDNCGSQAEDSVVERSAGVRLWN